MTLLQGPDPQNERMGSLDARCHGPLSGQIGPKSTGHAGRITGFSILHRNTGAYWWQVQQCMFEILSLELLLILGSVRREAAGCFQPVHSIGRNKARAIEVDYWPWSHLATCPPITPQSREICSRSHLVCSASANARQACCRCGLPWLPGRQHQLVLVSFLG